MYFLTFGGCKIKDFEILRRLRDCNMSDRTQYLKEVLPTTGLLFQEEFQSFVLSKPKLIPLKSVTLQKLENMQQEAEKKAKEQMPKSD